MARPNRLELLTHGLEGRCSIQLSHGRLINAVILTAYATFVKFLDYVLVDVSNIFFGDGNEFFKSRRVVDGKFSHHFAVDGDARLSQAANQLAVRNAI